MRTVIATGLAATMLAGCTSTPEVARDALEPAGEETRYVRVVSPESATLSVIGTPFLAAFKVVTCAATVAVAGPIAALASVGTSSHAPATRAAVSEGIASNCGPPYAISPWRTVAVVPPDAPTPPPDAPPTPEGSN